MMIPVLQRRVVLLPVLQKRLREKLQRATAGNDIDELEKAMDRFQRHNLEDCGDYTRAKDRMEFLKLRRG